MDYVNEKRTEEEFGYKLSDLKPSSEKPIYRICEICKKEEIKKARLVLKFCQTKCLDCSNKINAIKNLEKRSESIKENWKLNGHPRLGVKHSIESKEKISTTRKNNNYSCSKETKLKISKSNSGEKNGFHGKKHSSETRAKMSNAAKKRAKTGKDSVLYGKAYFSKCVEYTCANGKIIKLRSSWEVKVAKYFDLQKINWEYEKTAFPVIYEFEGIIKEGTYIPDFFLENGEVWEIKGYWRKDALAKFEAFKAAYPNIKIILLQKQQLIGLKIL